MTPAAIATAMLARYASGVTWGAGFDRACECVVVCARNSTRTINESRDKDVILADFDARRKFYAEFVLAAGVPDVQALGGYLAIAKWNDAAGRSFADVEAALKRVAGVAS
jgi:hypothetical protein